MISYDYIRSDTARQTRPTLSVLIPFYKDDPSALLTALLGHASDSVEILTYDDGTADPLLTERVSARIASAKGSNLTLITASENAGRSAARNYLTSQAKADWVLFLDADMRPDSPDFLTHYLDLITSENHDIIFGGFTVLGHSEDPDRELHRVLSEVSDCLSARERAVAGPQYVATSNLCVRKSILSENGFDPEFKGWGWEDSEWAARVSKAYRLHHTDNPAIHLGLETTETLLARFRDSAQNYVRFTNLHPELSKTLKLYATAYKIKRIPGQALTRPILKSLVKFKKCPIKLRLLALKLWRASWYAKALP